MYSAHRIHDLNRFKVSKRAGTESYVPGFISVNDVGRIDQLA